MEIINPQNPQWLIDQYSGERLRFTFWPIVDWDMDTDSSWYVDLSTVGIPFDKIITLHAFIRDDGNTFFTSCFGYINATAANVQLSWNTTRITLTRFTGSYYDRASYSSTGGYQRGVLQIIHVDPVYWT